MRSFREYHVAWMNGVPLKYVKHRKYFGVFIGEAVDLMGIAKILC